MKSLKKKSVFTEINILIVLMCIPILVLEILCATDSYAAERTEESAGPATEGGSTHWWWYPTTFYPTIIPPDPSPAPTVMPTVTPAITPPAITIPPSETVTTSPPAIKSSVPDNPSDDAPAAATMPPPEFANENNDEPSLPLNLLDYINDTPTAVYAVKTAIDGFAGGMDPKAAEALAQYSEEAIARASSRKAQSDIVSISRLTAATVEKDAEKAKEAVESALNEAEVPLARELRTTYVFNTDAADECAIVIDPSVSAAKADRIRIDTPEYHLTISAEFINRNAYAAPIVFKTALKNNSVEVIFNDKPTYPVILSMPYADAYDTIFDSGGVNYGGQVNYINKTLDARINGSGTYTVLSNKPAFTDLNSLPESSRKAILSLAARGIISGVTETEFAPNSPINRAQLAALVTQACDYYNENADGQFIDVYPSDWFFNAAGSAKQHRVMTGTNPEGT
ncbi:MAG: S-layer homology domain-containing protein, partial [Clostridiales bacterium]|nr:S-layer homology domain-containing protein [Clostridiales bacterium]